MRADRDGRVFLDTGARAQQFMMRPAARGPQFSALDTALLVHRPLRPASVVGTLPVMRNLAAVMPWSWQISRTGGARLGRASGMLMMPGRSLRDQIFFFFA